MTYKNVNGSQSNLKLYRFRKLKTKVPNYRSAKMKKFDRKQGVTSDNFKHRCNTRRQKEEKIQKLYICSKLSKNTK